MSEKHHFEIRIRSSINCLGMCTKCVHTHEAVASIATPKQNATSIEVAFLFL